MGCVMTNKYAEGYPGKRYYGGCEWVDVAETLAIDRAEAALRRRARQRAAALRRAGEHGGLHGGACSPATRCSACRSRTAAISRTARRSVSPASSTTPSRTACSNDTELIDFDEVRALAREHKPKLIVAGASAYPRIMEYEPFREIADEVGAALLVDFAHIAGLVAVGTASVARAARRTS